MTTIQIFRNRRNPNKYIEVHNDGHYHNSLKQYLYWERNSVTGELLPKPVKNITGDRKLHRWRKGNLKELLKDYEPVTIQIGSKEYLVMADCLVDDCMMTWEIKAENDEQAFMKVMKIVRETREADSGSCDVIPIRGGAWTDPMNSCFFKEVKEVNGFTICAEYGKEYPDNMFAIRK